MFFLPFVFRLKRRTVGYEFGTENRFELRALVQILQRFKTVVIGQNHRFLKSFLNAF